MTKQDELSEILKRRDKIVKDYCRLKNWPADFGDLTIEQIMEIRSQEDWKKAGESTEPIIVLNGLLNPPNEVKEL